MKTIKWKVRDMILKFPITYTKKQVVDWCNTDFRICPYCGKIDSSFEHLNTCDDNHLERELRLEQFYK